MLFVKYDSQLISCKDSIKHGLESSYVRPNVEPKWVPFIYTSSGERRRCWMVKDRALFYVWYGWENESESSVWMLAVRIRFIIGALFRLFCLSREYLFWIGDCSLTMKIFCFYAKQHHFFYSIIQRRSYLKCFIWQIFQSVPCTR